jgi:predicted ArsR family transcriptional regulator
VPTRSRLLLLLRKHPGITVTELAAELGLTGVGVRRHLEALEVDGLAERTRCPGHRVGRPPHGWRLSATGMELLPRSYDTFLLQQLEDMSEQVGADGVDVVLRRRGEKVAAQYREELAGASTLDEQVAGLARVRDQAGYLAEWRREGDVRTLVENNCAVHRVAERFPAVCAMELALFRRVLGPDVEVTRVSHTMAGDATCTYRIRPRPADPVD